VRTNGGGDIQVILKDLPPDVVDAPVPQPASPPSERAGRPIRSEVWQAFANPDPERRRFLDRQTFQICHYTPNHYPEVKDLVERNPSQYAEIPPIAAETQKGWMRDFLARSPNHGQRASGSGPNARTTVYERAERSFHTIAGRKCWPLAESIA
jgi:hypothetical protein